LPRLFRTREYACIDPLITHTPPPPFVFLSSRLFSSPLVSSLRQAFTGFISNSSAVECVGCAPGRYRKDNQCLQCEAGKFSGFGQETCQMCSPFACAGGCSSPAGSATCTKCPPGKKSEGTPPMCVDCEVGKYQDDEGQEFCSSCLSNKISEAPGAAACDWCAAGKYEVSFGDNGEYYQLFLLCSCLLFFYQCWLFGSGDCCLPLLQACALLFTCSY
jgi:hypothetical protein